MHQPARVAIGVALVAGGLLSARYSYRLSRFSEQLDAIGSRTRLSEVEPAGWKVTLNRIVSLGTALFGALWLALAILD